MTKTRAAKAPGAGSIQGWIRVGAIVTVYQNPVTCEQFEGNARVVSIDSEQDAGDLDVHGRPLIACRVVFKSDAYGGNEGPFERRVSALAAIPSMTAGGGAPAPKTPTPGERAVAERLSRRLAGRLK